MSAAKILSILLQEGDRDLAVRAALVTVSQNEQPRNRVIETAYVVSPFRELNEEVVHPLKLCEDSEAGLLDAISEACTPGATTMTTATGTCLTSIGSTSRCTAGIRFVKKSCVCLST